MQTLAPIICLLLSSCKCSVVSMLKSKGCGGKGNFQLIEHFARHPRLKVIHYTATSAAKLQCLNVTCTHEWG